MGVEVVANKDFRIETGKIARQADGAVLVSFGETKVLATVTRGEAEDLDYFPLIVDYEEKFYAGGKIPGGFIKREGRPSDEAILNARMIDRPIRPLFPEGYKEKVHVVVTVLSADKDHPPEIAGMLGVSSALMISPVPFQGPIAGVRLGKLRDEFIINPTSKQMEESELDVIVAGTKEAVIMVEGSMKGFPEGEVIESIRFAHKAIAELIELQEALIFKLKPQKIEVKAEEELTRQIKGKLSRIIGEGFEDLTGDMSKKERQEMIDSLREEAQAKLLEEVEEGEKEEIERIVEEAFEDLLREFIRKITLEGKRIDGRRPNEIRPTWCEVGILPRVHGSALFTRGETQSLGTCTLGTTRQDEQIIDQMLQEGRKRFMMHYNFPPYSVGETGRLGPPGRREIGHGHLAEEALKYVLPTEEEFPYIIRVVSEILESNGSSSMATVCSGSLALMDAGVPIKEPVAGIAMGLIKEGDRRVILTDIIGLEDKFGDMDFKVAGTENGVMAFQMDVKCGGIPYEVMEEAMKQAKNARLEILKMMEETLDRPRPKLSPYAPKLEVIKVDPDKVGLIIGPGGRMVRKIIDKTEVEIDIEDDGTVKISGIDKEGVKRAVEWIEELTEDLEVGRRYRGKVVRIEHYGAFVEIKEGIKGMVHISDLSDSYVKRVEDVVKVGDEITVEVIGIDEMGRPDLRRVPESQLQSKVKETKPKEKEDKPWIGDVVRGVVKNTTSFGAFVELDESGIIGLIHISDLAEDYVKQVEDVVKPGDRVLAQVIRIDKEGKYYLRRLTKEGIKFKLKA